MMKKHPLRVGLALFLGLALVFFLAVLFSTSIQSGSLFSETGIALVKIEGVIADSREVVEELKKYRDDPSIKAILLRIDSPGGGVVPSQEIYGEVKKIRKDGRKKVVTSMGNVAASGGYYIASASDRIMANPGTLTGSIGVIMELANVEGLLKKIGVETLTIKSGRHKDIGSPFRAMQPEEREFLEKLLKDVHEQFIQAVSEGRGLPREKVREVADGRIFSGRQAKEMNLVDDLGSLQDAIHLTAGLVGIEGEPRVVETRKRASWLDFLRSQWTGRWAGVEVSPPGISIKYLLAL
jgi:protease-4